MNLKRTFTTIHILLIVLLIILSVLTLLMFQNKANVKKNNKNRLKSYALATKLRKTSDDLTRYCRTYVLTGESSWEKKYWKILSIRNGIEPWPDGRVISFHDSLKNLSFTQEELQKLKLAEQYSNNLVYTEKVAMNAMKGLFDDGTENFSIKGKPDTALAHSILFDKKYHENKAKIMQPIEEFFVLYQQRIKKEVQKYDSISYWLLGIINVLILLIIAISTISYIVIKNKIIRQLDELKKAKERAEEIATENLKLSVAVEQSANSIVITNVAGNIEFVNLKFTEVSGYSVAEVLGKSLRVLDSGLETEEFYTKIWEIIKSGNTWKGEIQNKAKNGNLYWEQTSITPIKNNEGIIIYFLTIKEDITALKESEQRLHTLINASPDVILFKDGEGKWIEANKATLELFELTTIDYKGKTDADLAKEVIFYKEALDGCNITDEIAWKHKEISFVEEIVPTPSGIDKILDTIKIPLFNKDNSRKGLVIMARDITERKRTQQILKESETNLVTAQEIAKIGSFDLDLKTQIAKTSRSFNIIVGLGEIKGASFAVWRTITHPEDSPNNQKMLENCIKTGKKFDLEYRIITKDTKELKWVHGLGETVYKKGEPTNFTGTIQDITERKKAEQELLKEKEKAEESNRLKTEFLNNMSHEIRTPMNGILGFSSLLAGSEITDKKRKYFVSIIQNSGNQLLHIIDDLLEISRLGTKQVKVIESKVCLNNVLLEQFSIFDVKAKEQKTALYINKQLLDKPSTIFTDKVKLNKVLSNLLENALKFTTQGVVEIGYQLKKNGENSNIEIYVKDSGVGIDLEHQKLIFERFSQAEKELSKKVGGLGLGLSIAKENTELLGGEISVVSKKGEGATFFITIPYKPVYKATKVKNKKKQQTILIAEDEEINYLYLETLLSEKYKIVHAKNGLEAVEIIKNNLKIDLVLMDLKMPLMNGYKATKELRKLNSNIPIIAQTAYSTKADKEKAISAGCNDFISKPIDIETLFKTIESYLKT